MLLGPEDSKVDVKKILRKMRAGGRSRIFELFNTKEKGEHLVASKVRWDERQRQRVEQEERTIKNVQEADDDDDSFWTEVCEGIAKKMLKKRILSPNESNVKNHVCCEAGEK